MTLRDSSSRDSLPLAAIFLSPRPDYWSMSWNLCGKVLQVALRYRWCDVLVPVCLRTSIGMVSLLDSRCLPYGMFLVVHLGRRKRTAWLPEPKSRRCEGVGPMNVGSRNGSLPEVHSKGHHYRSMCLGFLESTADEEFPGLLLQYVRSNPGS